MASQPDQTDSNLAAQPKQLRMGWVYTIVLMGMVIGSFTTSLTKVVMNMGVGGETISLYRMVIVVVCLLPVCLSKAQYRQEIRYAFSDWRTSGLLFVLGLCKFLGILFAAYGVRYIPILVYNTVWNLNPVFVIILAYYILHEKVPKKALLGVAVCVLGVLIVGGKAIFDTLGTESADEMILGVSIAAVSAVAYAFYMVVSRLLRSGFSLPTLMFVLFAIAAALDLVVCLFNGASLTMPLMPLLITVVLALLCTLLSQSLPIWAMRYMSPSLYSLMNLLSIVFSAFTAFLLLGEIPTVYTAIGVVLLIIGLFIYTHAKNQAARPS